MRFHLATLLMFTACATDLGTDTRESALSVPTTIEVPDGHHVVASYRAIGYQVHECRDGAWAFRAPAAILLADDDSLVAVHYGGIDVGKTAGPYWQSSLDGSLVRAGNAVSAPSPDAIPLLRLEALEHGGEGIFSDVSYIQRLDTTGGVGPTGTCRNKKARAYVPYTATYVFWAPSLPRPEVPATIAVPEGHDVAYLGHAEGAQIYECALDASANPAWRLRAPTALLVDDEGLPFVSHFGGIDADLPAGPYWQSLRDGSRVRAGLAIASPSAGTIPHLRLTALDTAGNGVMSRVSYIHRLATTGGVAPTGACQLDDRAEVPYTADYYFYVPAR